MCLNVCALLQRKEGCVFGCVHVRDYITQKLCWKRKIVHVLFMCVENVVCVWGGIEVCTVCYTTSAVVVFALQSCHSCLLTSSILCLTVTDTLIPTALVFSSESVHKLTPGSSFSV